jgi:hypothetical protein
MFAGRENERNSLTTYATTRRRLSSGPSLFSVPVHLLALIIGAFVCHPAFAQDQPTIATPTTNTPTALPVPLVPSPVRVIRELIALPEAKRVELLAMYPDGLREPLEAKATEYLKMDPEARELRLQATDLRHYLQQLLPLDYSTRRLALEQVPESLRDVVRVRIEKWEILLPDMQQDFLASESVVRYFSEMGITSEDIRLVLIFPPRPDVPPEMERKIAAWNHLPEETRNRVFAQFNDMFDLSADERDQTLKSLSAEEREAMREALDSFNQLSGEQRRICLRSFEKFSQMTVLERRMFLQKAEAWSRMTAAEREQWKELVNRVPHLPPFPPGFEPRIQVPATGKLTNGG